MKGFEDVTLSYDGKSYVVPADRVLLLVAEVEDALRGRGSQSAVEVLLRSGGPSQARLAQAYGAALRFAGADVRDDEIYIGIQERMAQRDPEALTAVQSAILSLISIVSPPIAMALVDDVPGASKKKPRKAKA